MGCQRENKFKFVLLFITAINLIFDNLNRTVKYRNSFIRWIVYLLSMQLYFYIVFF